MIENNAREKVDSESMHELRHAWSMLVDVTAQSILSVVSGQSILIANS